MRLTVLLMTLLLYSSCKEDPDLPETPDRNILIDGKAVLTYTGSIAVDGCEFFLELDGKTYKPVNEDIIPEDLKNMRTEVKVSVELLDEPINYQCGLNPQPNLYLALRILSIRKA